MKTWLTSDLHLGHANIIQYCGRPFRDVREMNERLISNWNARVKPEDLVYHLGDFCFHRGVEGQKVSAAEWESRLNGKIVHILGNHDLRNGLRGLTRGVIKFAGVQIFLVHRPPTLVGDIPNECDMVACGHIHEKWKYILLDTAGFLLLEGKENVPAINCGVDVWSFRPVLADELVALYSKIMNGKTIDHEQ